MTIEADRLTLPDIPQYVHDEATTLAQEYRDYIFPSGEGLGVLACAVAVVDGSNASGRAFATEQLGQISEEKLQPYTEIDAWKYLAWRGDEQARDEAWNIIDRAAARVKQEYKDKGYYDGDAQYVAEQTAQRAYWLVRQCDDRPEKLQRAREAAILAAATGKTTRFLGLLYEHGDEESLEEELKLFDAAVANATEETAGHIRFLHEGTLCHMGVEAVARDRFDQVDRILERMTDDHSKVVVYAAVLGRGTTEGLPFIEEFVARKLPWEGGWRPRTTYALAEAGYQPAIERLSTSTDPDMVGHEEQRLYAKLDVGLEGARDALLAYIAAKAPTGYSLYEQLSRLGAHGLEAEALAIAQARYDESADIFPAYWLWAHTDAPDLALWPHAYAGAKERRGSDEAAQARALYGLARLATNEAVSTAS